MKCKECEYCVYPDKLDDTTKSKLNEYYQDVDQVIQSLKPIFPNLIVCTKYNVIRVNDNLNCIEEYQDLTPEEEQ